MNIVIRKECDKDFRKVEELTREAFWNLYVPGCNEHYLAHILRNHPDFIHDLDLVAVCDDKIISNLVAQLTQLLKRRKKKNIDIKDIKITSRTKN